MKEKLSNSTPCPYQKQAKHNEKFHKLTCEHFPNDFFDWKITTLFYVAIHYVKALAQKNKIDIGDSHSDIRGNIMPPDRTNQQRKMAFSRTAYKNYDYLYKESKKARYNGLVDNFGIFNNEEIFQSIKQKDHEMTIKALEELKLYINGRGLDIE